MDIKEKKYHCNELDELIQLYEERALASYEPIEDVLSHLLLILQEQCDEGNDPQKTFAELVLCCSHPLETFLYNFISDVVDMKNTTYALELLDDFSPYVRDKDWFSFLRLRLLAEQEPDSIVEQLDPLLRKAKKNSDLELHLEILSFMVQNGNRATFRKEAKTLLPLIKKEEHFQDLLCISSDFFHCIDEEEKEKIVETLLQKREGFSLTKPFWHNDHDAISFLKLMKK